MIETSLVTSFYWADMIDWMSECCGYRQKTDCGEGACAPNDCTSHLVRSPASFLPSRWLLADWLSSEQSLKSFADSDLVRLIAESEVKPPSVAPFVEFRKECLEVDRSLSGDEMDLVLAGIVVDPHLPRCRRPRRPRGIQSNPPGARCPWATLKAHLKLGASISSRNQRVSSTLWGR